MEIVSDPAPVFLSHHIVFFTSVDVGGCEDCYKIRNRLRVRHKNDDEEVQDVLGLPPDHEPLGLMPVGRKP
jgi:hypothetical protein